MKSTDEMNFFEDEFDEAEEDETLDDIEEDPEETAGDYNDFYDDDED